VGLPEWQKPKPPLGNHCTRERRISEFKAVVRFILITFLYLRKLSIETPVCPQERLVIISYTTVLSFALEMIGPLAAITFIVFYLLILYLLALPNTPENPFASIYSESLIKTTCQHLLLLVGFDTLIYRKYYDTPPILVGHHLFMVASSQKNTHFAISWN
jgi:hypothetical protein